MMKRKGGRGADNKVIMDADKSIAHFAYALVSAAFIFLLFASTALGQATATEEQRVIETYPFGDPNPVPVLARGGGHIYPYFSFDQYSLTSSDREWKVVRLENDYIEVFILPEVGGKVWGAVDKASGQEFIYLNEVLKFRNIALRGPWTSGGIEFNFGITGHTPTTSTPVDYQIRENDDGSVSCIVGALDLPSRTEWRVTITLPEDKAYFETESFWYNPTSLDQSYYVWMNAAVEAADDLQFFFPGEYYIGHQGDPHAWPIDEEGRDLSYYKNNDFGPSKSYHILGEQTEFFGGYWQQDDFGFGNWSLYSDMPGKKLWIWSLSRSGAIWEDLLTDTDGQYVEVQSGRLFSQAQGRSVETPFDYAAFEPSLSDRWSEIWFPVKETGGISAASPHGVLHVTRNEGKSAIALMGLQQVNDDLKVYRGDEIVSTKTISLEPLEVYRDTLDVSDDGTPLRIVLGDNKLVYNPSENPDDFDRPLKTDPSTGEPTASQLYQRGINQVNNREYERALKTLEATIEKDPAHTDAYVGLANLYYRRGEYDTAVEYSREALSHNTYHPGANFIHGVIKARSGEPEQALEALGWAARSPSYRSAAYASMAEIYLSAGDIERAIEFANRSLEFNQTNIKAYELLAVSRRKQGDAERAQSTLAHLLSIDPLNHFARFEQYLLEQSESNLEAFTSNIQNELPHETYLEIAAFYANAGLKEDAIELLEQAPSNPIIHYWLAYLKKEDSERESARHLERALSESPYLVFPFRSESIPVLKWAQEQAPSWQSNYYLGLIYWNVGRLEDAERQFARVDDSSDFAPFYLSRGKLRQSLNADPDIVYEDLKAALDLDPDEWRAWSAVSNFYLDEGLSREALDRSSEAYERFPDNNAIAMDYARALLQNRQFRAAVDHLEEVHILPSEHTRGTRVAYEQAAMFSALEAIKDRQFEEAQIYLEKARTWPENLGVGRPYDPDLRLQDLVEAAMHQQLGHRIRGQELYENIIAYTESFPDRWGAGCYAAVIALENTGRDDEAQELLEAWQEARPDDIMTRWASADFEGDNEERRRIAKQGSDNISLQLLVESIGSVRELTSN